jgi:hypothetical protein
MVPRHSTISRIKGLNIEHQAADNNINTTSFHDDARKNHAGLGNGGTMLLESTRHKGPVHLDRLGKLCFQGQEIATYLFQVPDDEAQWQKARDVVQAILAEAKGSQRRELPRVAAELMEALDGAHNMMAAELLQSGFDRLVRLWEAARSGLF